MDLSPIFNTFCTFFNFVLTAGYLFAKRSKRKVYKPGISCMTSQALLLPMYESNSAQLKRGGGYCFIFKFCGFEVCFLSLKFLKFDFFSLMAFDSLFKKVKFEFPYGRYCNWFFGAYVVTTCTECLA